MRLRDEIEIFNKAFKFCEDFELDTPGVIQSRTLAINKAIDYLFEETRETDRDWYLYGDSGNPAALEATLDGFGDVAFVAINGIFKTFRYLGQDQETAKANTIEVLMRICRANLAKANPDGTITRNDKGKVVKPKDWKAPEYTDLINP